MVFLKNSYKLLLLYLPLRKPTKAVEAIGIILRGTFYAKLICTLLCFS
jgi:hypothetical protein